MSASSASAHRRPPAISHRLTHAPDIVLIYESGTIATRPEVLPLSIGDGELCETALTTVSVVEMFRYWLQGGRITKGFLGGAQIDRFANLNTTVIGDYGKPKVRLPGGGGAPEIATSCGEIFIIMKQTRRSFVEKLDFVTSLGHGQGGDDRARHGVTTKGPTRIMTDLCVLEPEPASKELWVTSIHPGVTREQITRAHRLAGALCARCDRDARRRPPRSSRCCAPCMPARPPRTAMMTKARRPESGAAVPPGLHSFDLPIPVGRAQHSRAFSLDARYPKVLADLPGKVMSSISLCRGYRRASSVTGIVRPSTSDGPLAQELTPVSPERWPNSASRFIQGHG